MSQMVNIIIYKKSRKKGKTRYTKVGYGSGTTITGSGYIVTNNHVVQKGNYYQIILFDGTPGEVKLFKNGRYYIADHKTDIALLKLAGSNHLKFTPITMGDSTMLSEGEWVIAIGNPYGLRQSISSGIVSSKGRNDIGFENYLQYL